MNRSLQRQGINQFLNELYGHERLLSHILADGGLSPQEIAELQARMDGFLDELTSRWVSWFGEVLPERRAEILIRRYSLRGELAPTLESLGQEFDLSRERVRQLQASGIKRLRGRARKQHLEDIVIEAARRSLAL